MHYDVCILAPEGAFSRLLLLECTDAGKSAFPATDPIDLPTADLFLIDADAFPALLPPSGDILRYGITLSQRTRDVDGRTVTEWKRPFQLTLLRALLSGENAPSSALTLLPDGETVRLCGKLISLSPTEYACLSCLAKACGAPVSRAELATAVWGDSDGRDDLINLYIHYLRRKLEGDGRRRILSLRGRGYALREEGTE